MNLYRPRPVARRKIVCIGCLLLFSLGSAGGSCQPLFIQGSWTRIEVLDSGSGSPVPEVRVTADGTVFESGSEGVDVLDPGPTPLAPTDASGRTYVPVRRIGRRPFSVDLSLRLEEGQSTENITLPNRSGSSVETNDLKVRVVEVGAAGPTPPVLATVMGSRPPQITVNGYVSFLILCSNPHDPNGFRIESPGVGAYVETLSIGSVPLGFEPVPCSNPNDPEVDPHGCLCPSSVLDRIPPNGFILIAYATFDYSGGWFEGEPFCFDAEGAVIACP